MVGMTISIFSMLMGTLYYFMPYDLVQIAKWGLVAIIFPITIWFYIDNELLNAVKLYVPSVIFVIGVMIFGWQVKGDVGASWIIVGFLVTLGGASFVVTKV